ncbi:MAG: hypothetical protein LC634_07190 [Sphingomonadales bacterium]|nr:hypothetical protein [Sphingomonadales bacterium]
MTKGPFNADPCAHGGSPFVWLSTVAVAALPTQAIAADRFAIACLGTAQVIDTVTESRIVRNYDVPRQTYVVDEEAETVKRALLPRQEFEDVCSDDQGSSYVSLSPGLIQANSRGAFDEIPFPTCEFRVDRMSGEAEYQLRLDFFDGRSHEFTWSMTCEPTKIPTFDLREQRF